MPRTRSLAFSELKIGILAVTAIVIAAVVIFMLSGQGGFFWQRYSLKARFDNAAGLKTGAPVRLAGVEVGSVSGLRFVGSKVDVLIEVSNDQRSRITTDSVATIGSMGLLGQATVDITASARGTPIPDGGFIPAGPALLQISDVAGTANKSLENAAALLQQIREGRGTVGQLFTNDKLYNELVAFVSSAEQVTEALNHGQGTMGALVKDRAAYENLTAALGNLKAITATINAGEGSLGKLLHDQQFANSLTAATTNAADITASLKQGRGSAGRLLYDSTLYDRLDTLTRRLDELTASLNEGQGTAGQLLHNKQMYDNLNAAAEQLKGLIGDIRANPKKYLNVKVSVF